MIPTHLYGTCIGTKTIATCVVWRWCRSRCWCCIVSLLPDLVAITVRRSIMTATLIQVGGLWLGHGRTTRRARWALTEAECVSYLVRYDVNKSCRIGHAGINVDECISAPSVPRKPLRFALRCCALFVWYLTHNGNDWRATGGCPTSSPTWLDELEGNVCPTGIFPLVELILDCLLLGRTKGWINHHINGSALFPSGYCALRLSGRCCAGNRCLSTRIGY